MKRVYKCLEGLSSILFTAQKAVLLVMVVAIVGITICDVFLRVIVSGGLSWAQEVSITLFMFLIFLGANIAMKTNSEIKIELFHLNNSLAQSILLTVVDIISLAAIAYMFVSSVASVRKVMVNPQYLATVHVSYTFLYAVMPIGFFLMFLDKVVAMLRRFYDADLSQKMRSEADEMESSDK